MHVFLVITVRHMGIRQLSEGEKATETTSFASTTGNGEHFARTVAVGLVITRMSKYFPPNTSWLPSLMRRMNVGRKHYYIKIFQCVFETPLLNHIVE